MLQLNGNDVAPGFRSRLNALSLRLERMGHPAVGVASGKRSKALQEEIFRDRYRRQRSGGGPYGDVRWWDGDGDGARERWVRVKAGGTVLPPGDSTHEDPPATGADLSWPYNNRYTAAHAALVAICEEYGIRWTGVNFGEDWHFDSIWDAYASFAAGEAQPFEEDEMTAADAQNVIDKLTAHINSQFANFLLTPHGWGYPEQTARATAEVLDRIRGPKDVPWDYLQRASSILEALASASSPAGVDVPKLLAEIEERLRSTFQQEFESFELAVRAQIVVAFHEVEGVSPEVVEAAVDKALGTLRIERVGSTA